MRLAAPGGRLPAAGALAAALFLSTIAPAAVAGEGALRIVAFGTSLTARGSWPDDLRPALAACIGLPVEVERVARPGATSAWALTQLPAVTERRPDVVLIEFSANDAALDRFVSPARSQANMVALLRGLRARLPDARLLVMSMNPVYGLRGWMRPRLAGYVAAHREAAAREGAGFLDFEPFWRDLSADELADAIPDGLHPRSAVASAIMVPQLVRRLAGAGCIPSSEGR